MKVLTSGLTAHLAGDATTLCSCIRIERKDGVIFGFTDHDVNLTVGGVPYISSEGGNVSAIVTNSGLNVDNLEISGFMTENGLNEHDVRVGLWDAADIQVFEVNWTDLSMGMNKMRRGVLGDVTVDDNVLKAEVRGLAQWLQQTIGELCSRYCKADLFDTRCGVVPTEGVYKFSDVAVTTIVAIDEFVFDSLTQVDGFFTNGHVVAVDGDNAGVTREIQLHVGPPANIRLFEEFPFPVALGDTFIVYAGCRKRFTEDCVGKFDNGIRFRGFPHLPGQDAALEGPA